MVKARRIVGLANVNPRPEYYLGYGASRQYLNETHLLVIYRFIFLKLGNKPARAFVDMIKTFKFLSPTNFLTSLYLLEENDWVISNSCMENDATSKKDDVTENIKESFLRLVGTVPDF